MKKCSGMPFGFLQKKYYFGKQIFDFKMRGWDPPKIRFWRKKIAKKGREPSTSIYHLIVARALEIFETTRLNESTSKKLAFHRIKLNKQKEKKMKKKEEGARKNKAIKKTEH